MSKRKLTKQECKVLVSAFIIINKYLDACLRKDYRAKGRLYAELLHDHGIEIYASKDFVDKVTQTNE